MNSPSAASRTSGSVAPPVAPDPAWLLQLVAQTPVGLWTTDRDLRFTWGGGGGLAAPAETFVGKTVGEFLECDGPDDEPVAKHRRALEGTAADYRLAWHGRLFDVHCAPLRDGAGAIVGVIGVALDVTERTRDEQDLRASREQLRVFAGTLESIREEEQTRIARDVHDELGQSLAALRFDLVWFAGQLPRRASEQRERVGQMTTQVDAIIAAVREIAADLRPPVLEEVGLATALEFLAKRMASKARRPCIVDVMLDDGVLDSERGVALYRLLQEAVRNAVCHAGGTWIAVDVRVVGSDVLLKVMDDGRGIREEDAQSARSVGLVGMRERARAFGGEVEIAGVSEGGTTVTVRLPLARPPSAGETA